MLSIFEGALSGESTPMSKGQVEFKEKGTWELPKHKFFSFKYISVLTAAPRARARTHTHTHTHTKDDECAVCLEEMRAGDSVLTLPCSHTLHWLCIEPWLMRKRCGATCPKCKSLVLACFTSNKVLALLVLKCLLYIVHLHVQLQDISSLFKDI